MKKIRNGTQLKLTNPKNAARPFHLTIKLIRADINQLEFRALKAVLDELILFKKWTEVCLSIQQDFVNLKVSIVKITTVIDNFSGSASFN